MGFGQAVSRSKRGSVSAEDPLSERGGAQRRGVSALGGTRSGSQRPAGVKRGRRVAGWVQARLGQNDRMAKMPELGPGPPEPARNSQVAPNGLCLAVPPVKPDFAVVGRGRCLMCCPCFKIAFCDLKLATASASARGRSFDPALQQSRSVRPRIRGQGRHRRRKNPELRVSELDARVSGGLVWIAEVAEVKRGRRGLGRARTKLGTG